MFRPEPSPTPTRALYVVTAFEGDDDAEGSSSRDFVRIPRNEARADKALREAGERWDQAHPAHGATGKKDYVVTPAAGVKDGTRVIVARGQ